MGGLFQPMHLLLILIIVLIIFGPSKLAGIGKELGKGIKNFKDSMSDEPNQTTQTSQPAQQAAPEIKPAQRVEEIKLEAKAPQPSQKENG